MKIVHPLLVTDMLPLFEGFTLSCTHIRLTVSDDFEAFSHDRNLCEYAIGETDFTIHAEGWAEPTASDLEEVINDACANLTLFSGNKETLAGLTTPFWLLPGLGIPTFRQACTVELLPISLFHFPSFQFSCFSKLYWSTRGLGGEPYMSRERLKIAFETRSFEGLRFGVSTNDGVNGVIWLRQLISERRYQADFFGLGDKHLSIGSEFDGVSEYEIDGIEYRFKTRFGRVTNIK